MTEFLVDANLPYKFELWNDDRFQHIFEINDEWNDTQIWQYAREKELTIITKDADFSNRIIASAPPPKVIHLKIGNMKLAEFRLFILEKWEEIERMSKNHKLVDVFKERIIGID